MKKVDVCVITGFGINADQELAEAFRRTGGAPTRLHVSDLISQPELIDRFAILAFPGGFSFGDHLGSGKVFASLFKKHLRARMDKFLKDGKLVIGICNGFQMLVKMGILPNTNNDWRQEASLIHNDSGVFEDRWVKLASFPGTRCVWTTGLEALELPVRHGEGKFVVQDPAVEQALSGNSLIALTYVSRDKGKPAYPENPNGSLLDIAGITDPTGRVFGLMPHPEAYLTPYNHPRWTRVRPERAAGLLIFEQGVAFVRKNVL
jgi:phosphoribosylformylglycinamidine synthase I